MKTYSLTFGLLLGLLGICSILGAISGAPHQIFIAVPALIVAVALLREATKQTDTKKQKTR